MALRQIADRFGVSIVDPNFVSCATPRDSDATYAFPKLIKTCSLAD